jgi:hypothetical protein
VTLPDARSHNDGWGSPVFRRAAHLRKNALSATVPTASDDAVNGARSLPLARPPMFHWRASPAGRSRREFASVSPEDHGRTGFRHNGTAEGFDPTGTTMIDSEFFGTRDEARRRGDFKEAVGRERPSFALYPKVNSWSASFHPRDRGLLRRGRQVRSHALEAETEGRSYRSEHEVEISSGSRSGDGRVTASVSASDVQMNGFCGPSIRRRIVGMPRCRPRVSGFLAGVSVDFGVRGGMTYGQDRALGSARGPPVRPSPRGRLHELPSAARKIAALQSSAALAGGRRRRIFLTSRSAENRQPGRFHAVPSEKTR